MQVKVIFPVAFFVKVDLFWATSIEICFPDCLMWDMTRAPVESSAAMAWTAK